jgi:hypothetical protein
MDQLSIMSFNTSAIINQIDDIETQKKLEVTKSILDKIKMKVNEKLSNEKKKKVLTPILE